MKKLVFKFFLISLFTCLSFFSIDKVYAYNYSSWTPETVYIDGTSQKDSWVTSNYTLVGVRTAPNLSLSHHLVYDYNLIHNDYDTFYNVTFVAYSDEAWDYSKSNFNGSMSVTWRGAGINYGGSCNVNSVGTDKFFTITCNDVRLEGSKHLYLDIYTNNIYNIKTNALFGIVNYIWSSKTSQQSLIDALNNLNNNQVISNQELIDQNKNLEEANKLSKDKLEQDKKHHDEIMDDDTSGANGEAESFFSGFSTETHGLTSIITAPLELIGNIAGSTCSPLALEVPFVEGKTLNLPCMSSIYKKHFGSLLTVYQTATFGLVAYWVCVRIFALVKDFKNPDHDEVEVMDL